MDKNIEPEIIYFRKLNKKILNLEKTQLNFMTFFEKLQNQINLLNDINKLKPNAWPKHEDVTYRKRLIPIEKKAEKTKIKDPYEDWQKGWIQGYTDAYHYCNNKEKELIN